jgi:hypothetical protein
MVRVVARLAVFASLMASMLMGDEREFPRLCHDGTNDLEFV